LMKVLSAVGFVADRDRGLELLYRGIRAPLSGLMLCAMFLFFPTGLGDAEGNLQQTKKILENAEQKWPNCGFYDIYRAFYFKKVGDGPRSIEAVNHGIEHYPKGIGSPSFFIFREPILIIWDFNIKRPLMRELAYLKN